MKLELLRVAVENEGAFGVLRLGGYPRLVTLEHTYRDENAVKIPMGRTRCHRDFFHRGGYETFEIEVAGHSRVLFHKGNIEKNSDGCVLVGARFGRLGGRAAILQSAVGFGEFMEMLKGVDEFELNVVNA